MSRSKWSEPVTGITTAESEKEWKRDANRKLRRATAQFLQQMPSADPDAIILPVLDDVLDRQPEAGPFQEPERRRKSRDPRLQLFLGHVRRKSLVHGEEPEKVA